MSLTGAPRAQRASDRAGHIGQAAHHLHDLIQRRALLVRAVQKAFQGKIDQLRITLGQGLIVQPLADQRTGPKIFDQHVGRADQLAGQAASFIGGEIEDHTLLVAATGGKESRPGAGEIAGVIAAMIRRALRFQLDDFRTEIGEHQTA